VLNYESQNVSKMENEFVTRDERPAVNKEVPQKSKKKNKKKGERKSGNMLIQILNGNFLLKDFVVNNLSFVFFVFLLLILLISKGYYCKDVSKKIIETQIELDAKTTEYYDKKARLEFVTRREVLVKKLNPLGIYETTKPPKVIRIKNIEE
jgi:Bacteriodetes cell division protein (FtsL-like)